MTLPEITLPREEVALGKTTIPIRSLSRAEAYKMRTFQEDPDAAEIFVIACGTDLSDEEVRTWREATDFDSVGVLVDHILALSGLVTEPDPKS